MIDSLLIVWTKPGNKSSSAVEPVASTGDARDPGVSSNLMQTSYLSFFSTNIICDICDKYELQPDADLIFVIFSPHI